MISSLYSPKLVEYLCSKNIGGLWVLGTGSEDMNLSYKQRLEVAQTVAHANDSKVPPKNAL